MSLHVPSDPFLTDALGCARFCRDVIQRSVKTREDFDAAAYWSARCAAHWAQKSRLWLAALLWEPPRGLFPTDGTAEM